MKKTIIEWKKVPVDTLIEITYNNTQKFKSYFKCLDKDGDIVVFSGGTTSYTDKGNTIWIIGTCSFKILKYPCKYPCNGVII